MRALHPSAAGWLACTVSLPWLAGACSEPPSAAEWEIALAGKRLVHVHDEDDTRRDVLWLCGDGKALGRWNTSADDDRGPGTGDDIARWKVEEEDGRACVAVTVEDNDGLFESLCVPIEPDGDSFFLEDRRWTIAGDAGC